MRIDRIQRQLGLALLSIGLIFIATAPAQADWEWATGPAVGDEESGKDWSVELTPYFWLASLEGTVGVPPVGSIGVSQTFDSLSDNLEAGFAGFLDVRYRRWHLFSDNSWLKLKFRRDVTAPFASRAELELQNAFGTAAVAYELPLGKDWAMDLYLGARWWFVDVDLQLIGTSVSGDMTEVWADVVGGVRFRYAITESWRVKFVGDVGGGAADLDWMVFGGLNYRFNKYVGAEMGYRVLGVDYQNDGFEYDVKMSGLVLGVGIYF